jgi:cell division protein FtsW (lipid II flippase)
MSPTQIRTIIYSLSGIFGIAAIFLTSLGKIILLVLICIITIFLTQGKIHKVITLVFIGIIAIFLTEIITLYWTEILDHFQKRL